MDEIKIRDTRPESLRICTSQTAACFEQVFLEARCCVACIRCPVWILWKTYKETVVPIQQKEALSESLIRLEREKKEQEEKIPTLNQHMRDLNNEVTAKQAKLQEIVVEKDRLSAATNEARTHERDAKESAAEALKSVSAAKKDLIRTQWSIYALPASLIIGIPDSRRMRAFYQFDLDSIRSTNPIEAFEKYLSEVNKSWPNASFDADVVASLLSQENTELVPRGMQEQFAAYLQVEARKLACPKPDFAAARSRIESIRITGTKEAAFDAMKKEVGGINDLRQQCDSKFKKIAADFFEKQGVEEPKIPKAVFEEMK